MAPTALGDTHIRKRPYQPSITSYFHQHSQHGSNSQSMRPQSPLSPLSPPLPADTQASLLSVGMRVRKSVPEGYKTHRTLGSAGFPFPSTAPVSSPRTSSQESYASSAKELMPFCGLHKTGGWAAQEIPSSSAPAVMKYDNNASVPELTFSQSTFASTQSSFASWDSGSRKRTYDEEAEEEIDAFFDEAEAEDALEASQRQLMRDDRPIARMKSSSRKTEVEMGGPVRVFGEDDFGEATFLVAPMDVDHI